MLGDLKGRASNLEATILANIEKKTKEKRLRDLVNKCTTTHSRLQDGVSAFEKSVDSLVNIYKFYHQWLESSKEIQRQIGMFEANILQTIEKVNLKEDEDGKGRMEIEKEYTKLNRLVNQKEQINKYFCRLRDLYT